MPEREKKPAIKFLLNIPRTLKLVKMFKEGSNEYGPWFGYNVQESGEELTMFATEELNKLIADKIGQTVTVNWAEVPHEGQKATRVWQLVGVQEKVAPAPKPDPLNNHEDLDSVRKDRKNIMYTCLQDAYAVADLFNGDITQPDSPPAQFHLNHEDIRAMAISFAIDFGRRYGK